MSINISQVESEILKLSACFDFKMDDVMNKLLHNSIKAECPEKFTEICYSLMLLTKRQWIDKFGFNSKPSLGDWLSFFNKQTFDFTEIASLECLQMIDIIRKFTKDSPAFLFKNAATNATIQSLGGLKDVKEAISKDGAVKADLSYFRSDFQKIWLAFTKAEKISGAVTGNIKKCINPGAEWDKTEFIDNPVINVPDLSLLNKHKALKSLA